MSVLVQSDTTYYYNCMAYKQQKFISHSSGDWKSKIKLLAWLSSREDLLLDCRLLTSHCILM